MARSGIRRYRRGRRAVGWATFLLGVVFFGATYWGHWQRLPLAVQERPWHDGVQVFLPAPVSVDAFDPVLYERVRSVASAVDYIRETYPTSTESERLHAAYEFVRRRFRHFMYPHHTFLSNPYLWSAERLFPSKMFDSLETADAKLRHSAFAPCGGNATTFIEIYRRLGGRAQFVSFAGHDVAEAMADGRTYFVDPHREVLVALSAEKFAADSELLQRSVAHLPPSEQVIYERILRSPPTRMGFDAPPSGSPRLYRLQVAVEYAKWIPPVLLCLMGVLILRPRRRLARRRGVEASGEAYDTRRPEVRSATWMSDRAAALPFVRDGRNMSSSGGGGFSRTLEARRAYLCLLARTQIGVRWQGKIDPSDIVQQTLLKACERQDQFRGTDQGSFLAWLRQILANQLAESMRRFKTDRRDVDREKSLEARIEESSMQLGSWLAAEQSSPSQRMMGEERLLLLAQSLAELPDDQRIAVELHHLQGLSVAEVGETLGRSRAAAMGLIFRGLKRLRELMHEEGEVHERTGRR